MKQALQERLVMISRWLTRNHTGFSAQVCLDAKDALDLAEKALEAFEAHYPHGLNPYCDDAVNQARTALKAIKGVE